MSDYQLRLRDALIDQHKEWFDYCTKTIKPEYAQSINCPVCESNDCTIFFEKDWFKFAKCSQCGMVYLNPRLNEKATYQFYNSNWNKIYNESKFDVKSSTTELDDHINQTNLDLIAQNKEDKFNDKGNLLEIGIGSGYFIRKAVETGYNAYGVELNINNCLKVKELLGNKIYNTDLYAANFSDDMFDVIYMRDVFEHVPDPRKMLVELNRIARKDCVLFIEVPNIEGLIYKIVKEKHVCIFGCEHVNYWSPQTLSKLLDSCGFHILDIRHESLDFTVQSIISYYLITSFTSIKPTDIPETIKFLLKVIRRLFSLAPLAWIDQHLIPLIANKIGRGSVIKVIAKKQ